MINNNFTEVKQLCYWVQHILPLVYDDSLSYMELLGRVTKKLNELIINNNKLPDFIAELIKEYISSGAIEKILAEVLADYMLNVKFPPAGLTPATGDGSADDTEAIQGCIDYASANGGVVYFPYGSYLTQSITLKSGVSLFGFDRYKTRIILKGGATNALLNGNNIADIGVVNLTLDGNSGIQVNDVNVISVMAQNMLLDNLIIKDGYSLVGYSGLGGYLQINNVVFGSAVQKCFSVSGTVDVQMANTIFNHLSSVAGVSVLDIMSDGGVYEFVSKATCTNCVVISGDDNKIVARVENATNPVVDTGDRNNIEIVGVSDKEYLSGDKNISVGGDSSENVTGDKDLSVSGNYVENITMNSDKTIAGNASKHIAGAYTKTVDGNATESFDGTFSKQVTGATTETYLDSKTVTGANISETYSGQKSETSQSKTENVTNNKQSTIGGTYTQTVTGTNTEVDRGNKIVNVEGNIQEGSANKSETTGNKTVTASGTITENAQDIALNPTNPLTYKTPTPLENSDYFDSVPFKDNSSTYQVLVANDNTTNIVSIATQRLRKLIDGCNVCFIGDSIGVVDGNFATLIKQEYPKCNVTNLCVSGATISTATANNVISQLSSIPENADFIVMIAGVNDISTILQGNEEIGAVPYTFTAMVSPTQTTFLGGATYVYNWLQTNRPNAKVLHILTNGYDVFDTNQFGIYNGLMNLLSKTAQTVGINTWLTYNELGSANQAYNSTYFTGDHLHFSAQGFKKLFPTFVSYLINDITDSANQWVSNIPVVKNDATFSDIQNTITTVLGNNFLSYNTGVSIFNTELALKKYYNALIQSWGGMTNGLIFNNNSNPEIHYLFSDPASDMPAGLRMDIGINYYSDVTDAITSFADIKATGVYIVKKNTFTDMPTEISNMVTALYTMYVNKFYSPANFYFALISGWTTGSTGIGLISWHIDESGSVVFDKKSYINATDIVS